MSEADLRSLIGLWLDGRIEELESKRLQQELLKSASARSLFRRYANLDSLLHEVADTSGMLGSSPLRPHAAGQATTPYVASMQATLPFAKHTERRRNRLEQAVGWMAACAAGALLGVSLLSLYGSRDLIATQAAESPESVGTIHPVSRSPVRKPPAPVATLSLADLAQWDSAPRKVGEALHEGETISLNSGKVRVSIGYGAEIVADAPLSLTFLSRRRVKLHHGHVAVDVAPWAKGFTVETEDMDVVDLGTTFTVSASPGTKSEAAVLKGMVRVHPSRASNGSRRGVLVTEGEQVSINENGFTRESHPHEVDQLLRDLDFGATERYRPVALHNTGYGLSVGDEDMHWKVIAGPSGDVKPPQFATVCLPHERYLPNNSETSQWVSVADWQSARANSTYTFQAEFDLAGYDLATMQLFGRFLADNGVTAVRVNGEPIPVRSWVDNTEYQPFKLPQFRFVNITEGLMQGRNVIEVDVRNGMQRTWDDEAKAALLSAIPNPMALRVEWYAFGRRHSVAKVGGHPRRLMHPAGNRTPLITLAGLARGM
ncbi:FecR protein [Planctomycetes bacterium MalM25]|nr:FecR protein [Planctomycetes bacterium MalM25]